MKVDERWRLIAIAYFISYIIILFVGIIAPKYFYHAWLLSTPFMVIGTVGVIHLCITEPLLNKILEYPKDKE